MFKFIKNLFGKFLASGDVEGDFYEEEQKSPVLSRDSVNIHDREEREEYVKCCLDQITDGEDAIADLTKEYAMVTAYLTDMEELDAAPPQMKKEIAAVAEKITAFENEKNVREAVSPKMSDEDFYRMQRMEDTVQEAIDKLVEVESYQEKIHQDMRKLSGEHHAFLYRRHDISTLMVNLKGMLIITAFAFVTCITILYILKAMLYMDIRAGYILTVGATACSIAFIFFKYNDSVREQKWLHRAINRVVMLQNRVKIKYVNNTNLLDYLYIKYDVSSAKQLIDLRDAYLIDKDERLKLAELFADLEFHHKELIKLLRNLPIKHPHIWIKQAYAIGKKGEMVEIRHSLIVRRQKLREQMDHNEKLCQKGQQEIKSLIDEYPQYSAGIIEQVSLRKAKRDGRISE